jgi:hypothetical protein
VLAGGSHQSADGNSLKLIEATGHSASGHRWCRPPDFVSLLNPFPNLSPDDSIDINSMSLIASPSGVSEISLISF